MASRSIPGAGCHSSPTGPIVDQVSVRTITLDNLFDERGVAGVPGLETWALQARPVESPLATYLQHRLQNFLWRNDADVFPPENDTLPTHRAGSPSDLEAAVMLGRADFGTPRELMTVSHRSGRTHSVGQFAASPNLRLILRQTHPKFDLAYAMNNGRVLIANLAKARIGEQAASLLGSLLVSHLQLAAMERSALPPEARVPFYVHVDGFQSFGTDAFASLLSEARKFATHFCLVNQFTNALAPSVRPALLGNAGSLIVFRVSNADAELLAPEFYPLRPDALVDQPEFFAWLKRRLGHERIKSSPPFFSEAKVLEIVQRQNRRNFGRSGKSVDRSFH